MRNWIVLAPAIILAFVLSFPAAGAGTNDPIRLLSPKTLISTSGFYIKNIIDERAEKQVIGRLVAAAGDIRPVDLQGGGFFAIRNYLMQSVTQNNAGKPIVISIKNYKIYETISPSGEISGLLEAAFDFSLEKESGNVPLTQYRSVTKYTRTVKRTDVIEPTLRMVLTNSLQFFTGG